MALDEFTLQELLQSTLVSLGPESWEFELRRTVPVAIYVDAGENQSVELGERIASEVREVLQEFGYEEFQEVGRYYGSFLQLNLTRSPEPEDGPTFAKKLANIKDAVAKRLRRLPWKEMAKVAGGAATIAVAIGTAVTILSVAPAGLAIGSFVIPAMIWTPILVAKEGKDAIEAAQKILTESQAARKALTGKQPTKPDRPPVDLEQRFKELEEEVRRLRESQNPPKRP